MDFKNLNYLKLNEDGTTSSSGFIAPDNMFYIMGSSWDFNLEDCLAAGYAPVIDSNREFLNGDSNIEIEPGEIIRNEDGSFTQLWIEGEIPLSEKRARFMDRNRLNQLSQTDWTQLPDSPLSDELKAEYAAYRQTLRDLPNTIDWDTITHADDIVWPREPGVSTPDPEENAKDLGDPDAES